MARAKNRCYICHKPIHGGNYNWLIGKDGKNHKVCADKAGCEIRAHCNTVAVRKGNFMNGRDMEQSTRTMADVMGDEKAGRMRAEERKMRGLAPDELRDVMEQAEREEVREAAYREIARQERMRTRWIWRMVCGIMGVFAGLIGILHILKYYLHM